MSQRREYEERAKRIEQYYVRHNKDKQKTYEHFMDEGLSKKTIYHVMRRHETRGNVIFKKPPGRRVSVCTPETFDRLANLFKDNPELSCREAAKKLELSRTTVFRILAKMRANNLETYKPREVEPRCPTCHQKVDPKVLLVKSGRKPKNRVSIKSDEKDNKSNESQTDSESM